MKGLIITGPQGCGKSTVTRRLCEVDSRFQQVIALTTRRARPDDKGDYEYVDTITFERLKERGALCVHDQYGSNFYGIRQAALTAVIDDRRVPILTITPHSAVQFFGLPKDIGQGPSNQPDYLLFFLKWNDKILNERLDQRRKAVAAQLALVPRAGIPIPTEPAAQAPHRLASASALRTPPNSGAVVSAERAQRKLDNSYQSRFTYVLDSAPIDEIVQLLIAIWDNQKADIPLPAWAVNNYQSA